MKQRMNILRLRPRALRPLVLLGLITATALAAADNRFAYSSGLRRDTAGAPQQRAVNVKGPPPQSLSTSCAPQTVDVPTPVASPAPQPVSPPPVASAPITDQTQLKCTGGLSVIGHPMQTFTVGITGQLVRVDIVLCSPAKNVRIDLTVTGTGSAVQSSTASLKLPHDYSDCAWYEFDYGRPLTVAAGDVLQLAITSPNHRSALWGFDGQDPDPYPYGSGSWRGHVINDFTFQTYIQ